MIFNSTEIKYLRRFVYVLLMVIFVMSLIIIRLILNAIFRPVHSQAQQTTTKITAPQAPAQQAIAPQTPVPPPIPPTITVTPQVTTPNADDTSPNGKSTTTSNDAKAQHVTAKILKMQREAESQVAQAKAIRQQMFQKEATFQRNAAQEMHPSKSNVNTRQKTVEWKQHPIPPPLQPSQPIQTGLTADQITNISKQIGDDQAQIDKSRTESVNEDSAAAKYRQRSEALKKQADYLFAQADKYSNAATDASNQSNSLYKQANELEARHAWWGNPNDLFAKSKYLQQQANALNYQADQIRGYAFNIRGESNSDLSNARLHEGNERYAKQQINYFQSQIKYLESQLHPK